MRLNQLTSISFRLFLLFGLASCDSVDQGESGAAICLPSTGNDFISVPSDTKAIQPFLISRTEITNTQFSKFIKETGYVTDAEKTHIPGAGGGAVFTPPQEPGQPWWVYVKEANWRQPEGLGSSTDLKDNEPVVQVSYRDAVAYATWAGGRLPSEKEWEYAAAAGSRSKYVWGEQKTIEGKEQANTWQGMFPVQNTEDDGYLDRAPVGCFKPNSFGLYDMIGNVWEWTASPARRDGLHQNIIKGGSFLCAVNYCQRYTVPSREDHERDFSTNHIGFRVVKDINK